MRDNRTVHKFVWGMLISLARRYCNNMVLWLLLHACLVREPAENIHLEQTSTALTGTRDEQNGLTRLIIYAMAGSKDKRKFTREI